MWQFGGDLVLFAEVPLPPPPPHDPGLFWEDKQIPPVLGRVGLGHTHLLPTGQGQPRSCSQGPRAAGGQGQPRDPAPRGPGVGTQSQPSPGPESPECSAVSAAGWMLMERPALTWRLSSLHGSKQETPHPPCLSPALLSLPDQPEDPAKVSPATARLSPSLVSWPCLHTAPTPLGPANHRCRVKGCSVEPSHGERVWIAHGK